MKKGWHLRTLDEKIACFDGNEKISEIKNNPSKQAIFIDMVRCLATKPQSNKEGVMFRVKVDILHTNNITTSEELENLYSLYLGIDGKINPRTRLLIRYGQARLDQYNETMKNRPKRKYKKSELHFCKEYWIAKGYTEEEASNILSKKSKKASISAHHGKTLEDYRSYTPLAIDYWTKRGYTIEEAESLRRPFIDKCSNALDNMVKKYGVEEGTRRYELSKVKRRATMMERYGVPVMISGCTSKESLRTFIPLYKSLRRSGISKHDIYWGIKGSKEYRFNDTKNKRVYFTDFTIPSKKVVVEYHNSFWHPREQHEWKGAYYDYETKKVYDSEKEKFIRESGYELIIIWEDTIIDYEELTQRIINDR